MDVWMDRGGIHIYISEAWKREKKKNLVNGISADAQKDAALPPGGVPKDPREASIGVKATPLDRNGKKGEGCVGEGLEVNLEVRG